MENLINTVERAMNMTQRNPAVQVKVCLSLSQATQNNDILNILTFASVVKPIYHDLSDIVKEFTIFPPKHVVDNVRWAERTAKYCNAKGIPALVVRS
jgi:hypothetical protein